MTGSRFHYGLFVVVVVLAGAIIVPVLAAEGQITVGYRGSGYYYTGDTIVFNGVNSIGNATLIRITGPGLPPEGVPPYSLNGAAGSGNKADFITGTTWGFVWDTSRIDTSTLKSGKYTVIVWDDAYPAITSTTSITIKQPDFYLLAKPTTAVYGEYITLEGVAEKGVSYMKINVSDASGNILHTFMSPVSTEGTFSYSFHVDMVPGTYYVTAVNPSSTKILKLTLTVTGTGPAATTAPAGQATTEPAGAGSVVATAPPASPTLTSSATRAGAGMAIPVLALALSCAIAFLGTRKNHR